MPMMTQNRPKKNIPTYLAHKSSFNNNESPQFTCIMCKEGKMAKVEAPPTASPIKLVRFLKDIFWQILS